MIQPQQPLSADIMSFNFDIGHFFGGPQYAGILTQMFNESVPIVNYLRGLELNAGAGFDQVPNHIVGAVIDIIASATNRDVAILAVRQHLNEKVGSVFFANDM